MTRIDFSRTDSRPDLGSGCKFERWMCELYIATWLFRNALQIRLEIFEKIAVQGQKNTDNVAIFMAEEVNTQSAIPVEKFQSLPPSGQLNMVFLLAHEKSGAYWSAEPISGVIVSVLTVRAASVQVRF